MTTMEPGVLTGDAAWLLEGAEPGDWSAGSLRRLAAERGWDAGVEAGSTGGVQLVPFGDAEARFAGGREIRELALPAVTVADGTAGSLAAAFAVAGTALTAALGPATSAGSHGLVGPWFTQAPGWGAPFLRWRRPGASTLELRATATGADLVYQPTDPYEAWRRHAHEWSDPETVGGFVRERLDPANEGLYTPGVAKARTWKALQPRLASFLATLPAEVTALGSPLSFMILIGSTPQISVRCDGRLHLRTGFRHVTDPAALGWARQNLPVQPWTLEPGGPGEVDGDRLAATLVETLKAERARSPARLGLAISGDGVRTVLFGLGLG